MVCAPVALGANVSGNGNAAGRKPDEFGGYATTQIVVKLREGAHRQLRNRAPGAAARRDFDPRGILSDRFQERVGQWQARRMIRAYDEEFADPGLAARHGLDRTFIIEVPAGTDTPAMVAAFQAISEEVEVAGLDGIGGVSGEAPVIPNDPNFSIQYSLNNTGQTTNGVPDADIDAPEAWSVHTGDPGTVIIAIIDSGVNPHIEFGTRLIAGRNTNNPFTPTLTIDECPHGTHVAGIAAASGNNATGIAGVTWGASIMPVRVLNGCSGLVSNLANGIIWAADNGADVANFSLQYNNLNPNDRALLQGAINYANDLGMILIGAAGNDNSGGVGVVSYPANMPNCLAVSGTTAQDLFAQRQQCISGHCNFTGETCANAAFCPFITGSGWVSNYGPQVEISAPGDRIFSTVPTGFGYNNGTSMASPHVAGVAALLKSFDPTFSNNDIRDIIIATVDDKGASGWDDRYGYGRLNAGRALTAAQVWPTIASSDPPNRAIDARQPMELDGSGDYGWDAIDVVMSEGVDAMLLTLADFSLLRHGGTGSVPFVIEVTPVDIEFASLGLSGLMKPGTWTTILHHDTALVRVGYLPGDVNGDTISTAADVTKLVASLSGTGDPTPEWSTDLDRSGLTTPLDILTEIDLLTGAEDFTPYLNQALP